MIIKLTHGKQAQLDNADAALVSGFKWRARKDHTSRTWYALASDGSKVLRMHRVIMGVTDPRTKVDHRDCDGLNNRRSNLRIATHSQNMANAAVHKSNTSGFKGVHLIRKKKLWRAEITFQGKRYVLGARKLKEDAARLYDAAAVRFFGEFARTNFKK
jgi:hypothetical protein